jgi:putative hydrolase of the HAD superfamily
MVDGSNKGNITTIIFDVDDTLYDVGCGFTAHRNGEIVQQYMVDHLSFPSLEAAKKVRDEYFERYHATAKALTVAQQEGRFPEGAPEFDTKHLAEYWVEQLDYSKLGGPKRELKAKLNEIPLTLVAFSNGPRAYVKRVLQTLDLFDLFGEERLFAVDDVLPHCKPEPAAFETVFEKIGHPSPETCIMVEDSMKNIRAANKLGMKTILITGTSEHGRILPEDRPEAGDPAVNCSMTSIDEITHVLPGLWQTPAVFEPPQRPR